MAEQETVQKSEYDLELESIEEAYDEKVKAVDKFEHLAHKKVPRLAQLLEAVQPDGTTLSPDDIRDQIHKDCKKYWTPKWIDECLPDKYRRRYDSDDTTEGDSDDDTLSATPSSDNPQAELIKDLRQKLKSAEKARTDAQKLYDKAHTKIEKMNTELGELKDQMKEFKHGQKLLDTIKPLYDEELNAIKVSVTGLSNTKLTTYFEDKHRTKPIENPTEFVFKFGKNIVLESVV